MGRRRVYADTAARQRAYRVRVAEERTSAREAVLDRIRDDPEEGARWLLQQLGRRSQAIYAGRSIPCSMPMTNLDPLR